MLLNSITVFAAGVVVVIVLEIIGNNESEVGVYAAITTISAILFVIGGAVKTVINPEISANADNPRELQDITHKANLIRLAITTPITLFILIFSKELLHSFNPLFINYSGALQLIVLGIYIGQLMSMSSTLLLYGGAEKLGFYSNIAYLFVALIVSFVLVS